MNLAKILDNLNSLEKNSFIKIIVNIIANNPKNLREVEKILSNSEKELKSADSVNISKIFKLVETEFADVILSEFVDTTSQLDILIDILTKDGNNIMKQDWFARLYETELKTLKKKTKALKDSLKDGKEVSLSRVRDYKIYEACLRTAYFNDEENNRDAKITDDELTILITLSNKLELSQEEIKLINYTIIPPVKKEIDDVINELKNIGVVFYSKKHSTVYVADEMVRLLRKIRGKEVADKFYRRVLKTLKDGQINYVCRKHNIEYKLTREEKIKEIINVGISFKGLLAEDIYKEGSNVTDRKKTINDLWSKGLKISTSLRGVTLEDKIANIVKYFEEIEKSKTIEMTVKEKFRDPSRISQTAKKSFVPYDEFESLEIKW